VKPGVVKTAAFNVVFRRLGQNAGPASATYTTRDRTATAGKDYLAQAGKITFAPLEVEKTLTIPILGDLRTEPGGWFEVVVTGGEGFEALPSPAQFGILDRSGGAPPPLLEDIKRLRDGRVLIRSVYTYPWGGGGAVLEASDDLQAWGAVGSKLGDSLDTGINLDEGTKNHPTRFYRWRDVLP